MTTEVRLPNKQRRGVCSTGLVQVELLTTFGLQSKIVDMLNIDDTINISNGPFLNDVYNINRK